MEKMHDIDGFESYVLENINAYVGQDGESLCRHFSMENKHNKATWVELAYRMLGISSSRNATFRDNKTVVKTIRLNKDGRIRESMSFNTLVLKEFAEEIWEESELYEYFSTTRFLFVVYKEVGEAMVFLGAMFWDMPSKDLEGCVKQEWHEVQNIVQNGVRLTEKDGRVKNNFPKKSMTEAIHLRPKANKSAYRLHNGFEKGDIHKDGDQLPSGEWMTRQCFWLNNDYVLHQLTEGSQSVAFGASRLALSSDQCEHLKAHLVKELYLVDEIKKLFSKHLGIDDDRFINAYNLKRIGYLFYYKYMVSDRYDSAADFVEMQLLSGDIVSLDSLDNDISNINVFQDVVSKLVESGEIFRLDSMTFINKEALKAKGLGKEMMATFCEKVKNTVESRCFTIQRLESMKHGIELFEYGFERCFYEDILVASGSFNHITEYGVMIFTVDERFSSYTDFYEEVVGSEKSITMLELEDTLTNGFGLDLSSTQLKMRLRFSDVYYSPDMDKAYIDYNEFLTEVE